MYTLITGASGGIGMELAKVMAANKHNLILVARTSTKLEELAQILQQKYQSEVRIFTADLVENTERLKLLNYLKDNNLLIDILVNNAGFGDAGFFAEADWLKNERMIQLNITALAHLTREILPQMVKRDSGRILNVASVAGFLPGPYMSVYYASKAFVVSFSAALHSELSGSGVTVTTLSPGPVSTNFFNAAGASNARLSRILKPANASDVAKFAYRRLMNGEHRAIFGWSNNLMIYLLNFVPSKLSSPLVKMLHS